MSVTNTDSPEVLETVRSHTDESRESTREATTEAIGEGLLKGKKVFISGGSRGLGQAICRIFAREGADVAFNYGSYEEGAQETLESIEAYGRAGLKYKVSVADRDGTRAMAREVIERFGKVDILVNNAAMNRGDNFATMTEKAWLDVIDVNVNGLYYMTKPFFKQIMRQRGGHILNIS